MKSINDIEAQKKRIHSLYPNHRHSLLVYKTALRYTNNIKAQKSVREWIRDFQSCFYKNGNVRKSCNTQAESLHKLIYETKWGVEVYARRKAEWIVSVMSEKCTIMVRAFSKERDARDLYTDWLVKYPNYSVEICCENR